jgi:D-sedoheptulose 7-phosphate isomerase
MKAPTTTLPQTLAEHIDVCQRVASLAEPVRDAAMQVARALGNGRKLMLCGNGGSASDCQHIAAELVGRFVSDRRALAAIALTTDTSCLTSVANDYSYDDVFARQVLGLGQAGDCLLAISTSGNSKNVMRAVDAARSVGVFTIGLLGRDGGALSKLCDLAIVVPSQTTARIQEAHILIGHTLCAMIEESLGLA